MRVCDSCGNRIEKQRKASMVQLHVNVIGDEPKAKRRSTTVQLELCEHCGDRSARVLLLAIGKEASYRYDEGPETLVARLDERLAEITGKVLVDEECDCNMPGCEVCDGNHIPF